MIGRSGLIDSAHKHYTHAASLYAQLGDEEMTGAMRMMAAEANGIRAHPGALNDLRDALETLRPFTSSVWRHNALFIAGRTTLAMGLPRAGEILLREDRANAERIASPLWLAEQRIAFAELLCATGRASEVPVTLDSARAFVDAIPGAARTTFENRLRLAEANWAGRRTAAERVRLLDSAATHFSDVIWASRAHVARARAHLDAGDYAASEADLRSVAELLGHQRDHAGQATDRAAIIASATPVFDALMMVQLAQGRHADALLTLERSRAVERYDVAAALPARSALDARTAIVSYALVGDTVITWMVHAGGIGLSRADSAGHRVRQAADRLSRALRTTRSDSVARNLLGELHDMLIAPIAPRIEHFERLTFIPDGELNAVPFAALLDRSRDEYLVERHTIRVASQLRTALAPARAMDANRRALFVSDPAFPPGQYPLLARLDGAAREVQSIASGYSAHEIVAGSDATPDRVAERMRGASLVHFAGHAIFDARRPDESFMVLAAEPDSPDARLTAARIRQLPLAGVDLIILSACQTSATPAARVSGLGGLADAFRSAGVGAILGSLWPVRDDVTAKLMMQFHNEFRRSRDAAAALRAAQLSALRSGDESRRSAASWSAFQLTH
jgi:CHAT domain-containing protein